MDAFESAAVSSVDLSISSYFVDFIMKFWISTESDLKVHNFSI